jgi:peptide/nickel transport system substrate-binding protein
VLVLLALLIVVPLSASQAQGNPTTMIWSLVGGDISTLNGALITDGNSFTVNSYLFDGLFRANSDTGQPEPALATWEASADGLTYTFTLRDAKWSDGTPITAADVKFTYDAILSDKVQSPRKADVSAIKSLEVKDDKTVVATLERPNCTIWGNGFNVLVPLPAKKFAADFSDFMTNPYNTAPDVVSGPYTFAEREAGQFVRLTANPNHWEGQSKIESIVFRIVGDVSTVNQALQTGDIDYAFMYPDQLDQLQEQEKFNTYLFPNANAPIVMMNYQDSSNPQPAYDKDGNAVKFVPNKFFGDKRVRQAIAMGYDKKALALTLGENAGSVPLSGPIVPSFYNPYDMSSIEPWQFDQEKAAALLEDAGWKMGADGIREKDGVKFEVTLVYSKLVDLWGNAALIMQDQLADIGIKINIQEMEWSSYLSTALLPGKYDITVVGFGGGTEVDGIAYNLLYSKNAIPSQGFNLSFYVNPEMDKLLDAARFAPSCDVATRLPIYQQIQKIARDDVPYDWLVSTTQVNVLNKRVSGGFGQWGATPVVGWTINN